MRDERVEMSEHLSRLAEAIKLVVDRGCALLGFLLGLWLDARERRATLPAAAQTVAHLTTGRLLTIGEVAARLDVCERTIRDLIRQDGFPDRRIGKAQRFEWVEVDAWTRRHREKLETKRLRVIR